eukprot:g4981.t1
MTKSSGKRSKSSKTSGSSTGNSNSSNVAEKEEEVPETADMQWRREHVEERDLKRWLSINGVKRDHFIAKGHQVNRLETFQEDLSRCDLAYMRFFSGLTELCINCQPGITSLAGIDACQNLVTLWANECSIREIDPAIGRCRRLRSLYLNNNRIRKLAHLSKLTKLEVLWVNNNRLRNMEGLDGCTSLQTLYAAENQIDSIGTALDKCTSLAELNLADNKVGSFKEILNLTRQLALRSMCFSDPHFGDNPVCNLCNYQTYVLYHLNQLTSLDTMYISVESKQLAEATYMKKKMYYNMRIKTLKRNTSNVIRKAFEDMQSKSSQLTLSLNVLLRQQKDLQRDMEERLYLPNQPWGMSPGKNSEDSAAAAEVAGGPEETAEASSDSHPSPPAPSTTAVEDNVLDALKRKMELVKEAIALKSSKLAEMKQLFEALKRELCDVSEDNIARLIVELETGGNIRLEDGKPTDVWYSSCVDLLKSRFFVQDFRAYNVTGLRVHRVTRIHNRFLRNCFDKAMEKVAGDLNAPAGGKRQLEYLFYSVEPRLMRMAGAGNELLRVADSGFRKGKEMRMLGFDEAIKLSNSVSAAHLPAVRAFLSECAVRMKQKQRKQAEEVAYQKDIEGTSWLARGVTVAGSGAAAAAAAVAARNGAAAAAASADTSSAESGQGSAIDSKVMYDVVDAAALRNAVSALNAGDFLLPDGQLLVVKVFLGNVGLESEARRQKDTADDGASSDEGESDSSSSQSDDSSDSGSSHGRPTGSGGNFDDQILRPSNYPGYHSVYKINPTDPKQRQWYCFDHVLVLPEYLIEFELVSGSTKSGDRLSKTIGSTDLTGEPLSEQEAADLGPLLRPLEKFGMQCDKIAAEGLNDDLSVSAASVSGSDPTSAKDHADGSIKENSQSSSPSRDKIFVINDQIVKRVARSNSLDRIKYLNLHGSSIRRIEGLEACVNLEVLILTFNEIHKMEGLESLVMLKRLELGFNLIKRIEGLRGLEKLVHLELNNNLLYRMEDVSILRKHLPELTTLYLLNNAMCDSKTYRSHVLSRLPTLQELDGIVITEKDRTACTTDLVSISKQMIVNSSRSASTLQSSSEHEASERLRQRRASEATAEGPSAVVAGSKGSEAVEGTTVGEQEVAAKSTSASSFVDDGDTIDDSDPWWLTVEQLDLNHRRIRRIQNLHMLKNLRRLSVADNELTRIEGLENCTLMEELVLEDNRILKLEGISRLAFLKKLDLGKNKLCKLENLESLVHLTQLSVEDNDIQSLSGLQSLTNLMELYICSNRISNLKEVQHLKTLPKLIILDLSGNLLCKHATYRLYCIYYLRKLKVLDGVGVDINEQQQARAKYSGKLTSEFLAEKIGHKYFEHIRELDLSSCRIREIEHLSGDEFSNLRELNLDNNMLTSVRGLHRLFKLNVLRLNHNRIRELSGISNVDAVTDDASKEVGTPGEIDVRTDYGLDGLTNLEVLQLGYNHVTDISALNLSKLTCLKVLFLQGNDIVRAGGFSGCNELRELVLDKNRIKYVDGDAFHGLSSLRELRMEENGLRSLSNFYMPHLQSLYLGLNRISDLAELDKLANIPFLMELSLVSNPISRKQLYRANVIRRLPTLKFVDGREVSIEERERVDLMFVNDGRSQPQTLFYTDNNFSYSGQIQGQRGGGSAQNMFGGHSGIGGQGGHSRVPVKLTSVNFETLTGFARAGQQLAAAAAAAANATAQAESRSGNHHYHQGDLPMVNDAGGAPESRGVVGLPTGYTARRPDAIERPHAGGGSGHAQFGHPYGTGLHGGQPPPPARQQQAHRVARSNASGSRSSSSRTRTYNWRNMH